jgi:hypothetical protein
MGMSDGHTVLGARIKHALQEAQKTSLKIKMESLRLKFHISKLKLSCLSDCPRNQEEWRKQPNFPNGPVPAGMKMKFPLANPYTKRSDL